VPEKKGDLLALLATMNEAPGHADPANRLVPFGEFQELHFARFVVLDDRTLQDLAYYEQSFPDAPVYLAFLGDCDGPSDRVLEAIARRAEHGLRAIFSHCQGFDPGAALLAWMKGHSVRPAATYVNFIGRTVKRIQEDAALHAALLQYLGEETPSERPRETRERLAKAVRDRGPALSPEESGPLLWELKWLLGYLLAGGALLTGGWLVVGTPLILLVPVYLYWLRELENSDPVIVPRVDEDHVRALTSIEDYDLVNQFSAFGTMKPGRLRAATVRVLLSILNVANWGLYSRGRLARIGTIHFARWVYLDDRRRIFFASNYDRSLETYADDFVNKVAFGINLVFSNGIGFPRTRFLILDGAKNERDYQHFLRRHQIPTQVWYSAYRGLTVFDINRNARIRDGLGKRSVTDTEIREWLALL
jgi:hypothetical protein